MLDLTGPLRKAARETPAPLYWFEDGAYNPEGHAVVAQALADFLSRTIPR